jgi:hypothetical protein
MADALKNVPHQYLFARTRQFLWRLHAAKKKLILFSKWVFRYSGQRMRYFFYRVRQTYRKFLARKVLLFDHVACGSVKQCVRKKSAACAITTAAYVYIFPFVLSTLPNFLPNS